MSDSSDESDQSSGEEQKKTKSDGDAKKIIKSLQKSNNELTEEVKSLENDLEKAKKRYKQWKENYDEAQEKVNQLTQELETMKKPIPKKSVAQGSKGSKYDIVIKINSLLGAADGWKVIFKDKAKIEKCFEMDQIAVGVMGRENVGKTYLVNKICGENFASGYFLNTEGLSIKYCDDPKKQLKVLMDSAGMNSAIFFYNKEEVLPYYKNKEKEISFSEFDKVKETMINDRCMTEYFIQNFILDSCNVILIIVEQLNQNDQKIIERIKHLYSVKKTIIIVHNLFKLEKKENAMERAEYEIEGAFRVTRQTIPDSDVFFYIEKVNEMDVKTKKNIVHLIMGKEGGESGEFFNKASLALLMKFIEAETEISKFNVLDKINQYWRAKHRIYFHNFLNNQEAPQFALMEFQEKKKKKKKKEPEDKEKPEWTFKLDTKEQLELKVPEFNVLGALKEQDLMYHMYVKQNTKAREKLYLFELPGCEEKPGISMKKLAKENEQVMTLNVKTPSQKLDGYKPEIGGINPGGVFVKKIKINDEFGEYRCEKNATEIKHGILSMRFVLKEEEEL